MGSVCLNLLRQLRAQGHGGDDLSGLMQVVEAAAGVQVRVPPT
jgi:hypothetical protein